MYLSEKKVKQVILGLIAFSAGSLLGGAFLHLIPESLNKSTNIIGLFLWLLFGFSLFFLLELLLNWHHCHGSHKCEHHKKPVTYLILVADGVHNFIGGLAIASSFLVSIPVGIITSIAAAAHEVPQELGDFAILIHGGWPKLKALLFNFFSALTIVIGGLITYFVSARLDTSFLLPFAAGNFIYIAASDLIPEIKHRINLKQSIINLLLFISGITLIWIVRLLFN